MSGGLKQQWGVGDPAQVGPDPQSQDLKAAFEKAMDAMAEHLQYTTVNGERARHDPLAARSEALVPRYQAALAEIDPADAAKAKSSIDSLLSDTESLGQEVAAFRSETEKAVAEWRSRASAYDAAVVQVEELQEWQHPKEAALRSLVDAIRAAVNDRAYPKAVAVLDQFLPKLAPIYEDFQKQKAAQKEYEPAAAALQPRLAQAAQPSFAKLAGQQSEIASSQTAMQASAQGKDFVAALAESSALAGRVDAYSAAVEELTRLKREYEQALAQVQPKLQAAPNPSPFNKLASQQSELTSGQQQMESQAQAEDFEQALTQANDLGTKADAYTTAVEELTRLKQAYEQALAQVQPKLQAAPNPSPFQKLASQQAELGAGQQQMEASAQAEDFESALTQANDLGTKAEAYTAAVEELTRLKQAYEQALAQVQPKLQAAPNPSPFQKLASQQAELTAGQQQMEASAQAEDFESALTQANELGTKAEAYSAAVEELTRLKQAYEQAQAQVQPKLQAAPNPSPFNKLAPQQAELASGQQQMEASAQAEEFEQALQQANELGTKVDAYATAVEELTRLKQEYEQALTQLQPKLQAAPNPSPFNKLAPQQAELASGQQQMETSAQAEEFQQALTQANDLGTKVDAYATAVEELTRLKQEYEQALTQLQPKLQAAPNPSPFQKLASQQAELTAGQQQMESSAQAEDFEQALGQATELESKVDAYQAAVAEIERQKAEYDEKYAALRPRFEATSAKRPKKLAAQFEEMGGAWTQMEEASHAEDYGRALELLTDVSTKVEAYETAAAEIERQKAEYDEKYAALRPRFEATSANRPKKLAAQFEEMGGAWTQMEEASHAEDYGRALELLTDVSTKVEAYETAAAEIERQKAEYDEKYAALRPRFEATSANRPKKLAAQFEEMGGAWTQMEEASHAEDYGRALELLTDVSTKVEAYETAAAEIERQKAEYDEKYAALRPRFEATSANRPKKLAAQFEEMGGAWTQMEEASHAEDYGRALELLSDVSSKVEAYEAAVAEIERQKTEYDEKYTALRPRFEATSANRPKKLAAQFEEMGGAWTQMEEASHAEDYGRALELLSDVSTKVEAYETAAAEIEHQKSEYQQKIAGLQPRLAEVAKSQNKKLTAQQEAIQSSASRMETAASGEDFGQALQQANDISVALDAFDADNAKGEDSPPEVTGVEPTSCPAKGGTKVTITGVHFTDAQGVSFDNLTADFTVESDTKITATTPDSTPHFSSGSDLRVIVTTAAGANPGPTGPTVRFGESKSGVEPVVPKIGGHSHSGHGCPLKGGIEIRITGTGFSTATSVKFGDLDARFTITSDTEILAIAPDASKVFEVGGKLMPYVTTPAGRSQAENQYLPLLFGELPPPPPEPTPEPAPPAVPVVPKIGGHSHSGHGCPLKGGIEIRITGTGFATATSVKFGDLDARFTITSDTEILAIAPDASKVFEVGGKLMPYVTTPAGRSQAENQYLPLLFGELPPPPPEPTPEPAPPAVPVVPKIGGHSHSGHGCPLKGGIEIRITGTGFSTATSVKFGDLDARFTITSDTEILAIAPDASKVFEVGGKLMPYVTTPAGRSQAENQYLPLLFGELPPPPPEPTPEPAPPAVPVVPKIGGHSHSGHGCPLKGGIEIRITGTGFATATSVKFGDLDARFTITSDTEILAIAPDASKVFEVGGKLMPYVTTPAGRSQAENQYLPLLFGELPPPSMEKSAR